MLTFSYISQTQYNCITSLVKYHLFEFFPSSNKVLVDFKIQAAANTVLTWPLFTYSDWPHHSFCLWFLYTCASLVLGVLFKEGKKHTYSKERKNFTQNQSEMWDRNIEIGQSPYIILTQLAIQAKRAGIGFWKLWCIWMSILIYRLWSQHIAFCPDALDYNNRHCTPCYA